MSSKPVHIAQISDLHIKPPGSLAYGRIDTARALERCVAALNQFDPAPDFVVISGDLADTPTADEYQYLKRLLAPLKLQISEHKAQLDKRTESLMAIHENQASLQKNIDEVNAHLAGLQAQSATLDQILLRLMKAAQNLVASPAASPIENTTAGGPTLAPLTT